MRYRLESTDMKVCATSSLLEKDQKANKLHKNRLKNPEKCYPGVTLLAPLIFINYCLFQIGFTMTELLSILLLTTVRKGYR